MSTRTQPLNTPAAATEHIEHAADRLLAAIDRVGSPVCVGLDPVLERLPGELRGDGPDVGDATDAAKRIGEFCLRVIDAVAAVVPCIKVQSACFERYRARGVSELDRVIAAARAAGLQVILDAKRGDVGISAEHYAASAFEDRADGPAADWLTINAYLGADAMQPFLRPGAGAFALVRTSNPGSDELQRLKLADGPTVAEAVARLVASLGEDSIGQRGYSALGAVIGATKRNEVASLRAIMPHQIFLVPGFGAQGAGVDDVLPCFNDDGRGAIITASRSVIYAFTPGDPNWPAVVGDAAAGFADEIRAGVLR